MRARSSLSSLLPCLLLGLAACDEAPLPGAGVVYRGPLIATLANDDVTLDLRLHRFGMQLRDHEGRVILDTFDDASSVAGDAARAYGPIGATHHETSFKISLVEGWDHVDGADAPWLHGASVFDAHLGPTSAVIDLFDPLDPGPLLHLALALDGPELRVDATVDADAARGPERALNQLGQSFVLPADEHFFGLGERLASVNHRGRRYECWVEEGGIGQGEGAPPGPENPGPNGPGMTHAPVPFYVSTRGYGLWMDTSFRTGFSLGADDPGLFRIYAEQPELHYRVLVHSDPRETIAHYTRLTGRARLPAPWVFGARRRVNRGALVAGVPEPQALRDAHVPTTVLDDADHFLPIAAETGKEAEIAQYNAGLHALGYKANGYYNPHVSVTSPATKDLVDFGRSHGYFVKLDDGTEFDTLVVSAGPQTVATIDLTNPDAVLWYRTLLQRALDLGYDGWMLDFGEYLPQRALLFDHRTGWEAHNAFPELYERVVFDHLRAARGDDFMFFARAAYTGSQASIPVLWSGDPAASFDDEKGLPAQVRAGVNAGISGFPFWGSDISGYSCLSDPPPDKEVYLRWAEFGALSSDMHDQNACAAKPKDAPAKWTLWSDAETTEVYGRYARLHTRLFPYLYAAAREATTTGLPILRHPVLVDPGSPQAAAVDLEYWFGPSLYVAPVVRRGALSRSLWLPPGRWFDWWTLAPYAGGAKITRDAPVDVLPLFLRSGGIVALLDPSIETLAPESSPTVTGLGDVAGVLDLRAAVDPGAPQGRAELVDGTVLDLALEAGALALPEGFTQAAGDAALAVCSRCGRVDPLPGGLARVRLTGAAEMDGVYRAGALRVHHHAPNALRPRWDVIVEVASP